MTSCLPSGPSSASLPAAPADDSPQALWCAAWCAAQQAVEPENALPPRWQQGGTLRQVFRVRLGGTRWRLRLSNRFGEQPLRIHGAQIALAKAPGQHGLRPGTAHMLRFEGQDAAWIAAGQTLISDTLDLPLPADADLALSLHLGELPEVQTGHPGSRASSFIAPGDQLAAAELNQAETVQHWYWLSDVETLTPPGHTVLVAIGDSITDGRGSTTDGNDRWTDRLSERLHTDWALHASSPRPVVLNAGLGGNRLLNDGIGPSLRTRFERDVLQRAGVTHALLQIGINDLGTWRTEAEQHAGGWPRSAMLKEMQAAYRELSALARACRVLLIASTITPWLGNEGYSPDADDEAMRQALNRWIRESNMFDGVADFDAALRDPQQPGLVQAALHCGDHLHPSPAGMQALAMAVPLDLLAASFKR